MPNVPLVLRLLLVLLVLLLLWAGYHYVWRAGKATPRPAAGCVGSPAPRRYGTASRAGSS